MAARYEHMIHVFLVYVGHPLCCVYCCFALQIVIKSEQMPTGLRNIAADHVNKLLKVCVQHALLS